MHDLARKYNLYSNDSFLEFFKIRILDHDELLIDSLVYNVIDDSLDIIRSKIIKLGCILKFLDLNFNNHLDNFLKRINVSQKLLCYLLLCNDEKNYRLYKTYDFFIIFL